MVCYNLTFIAAKNKNIKKTYFVIEEIYPLCKSLGSGMSQYDEYLKSKGFNRISFETTFNAKNGNTIVSKESSHILYTSNDMEEVINHGMNCIRNSNFNVNSILIYDASRRHN